jgi:hypothetical protein
MMAQMSAQGGAGPSGSSGPGDDVDSDSEDDGPPPLEETPPS